MIEDLLQPYHDHCQPWGLVMADLAEEEPIVAWLCQLYQRIEKNNRSGKWRTVTLAKSYQKMSIHRSLRYEHVNRYKLFSHLVYHFLVDNSMVSLIPTCYPPWWSSGYCDKITLPLWYHQLPHGPLYLCFAVFFCWTSFLCFQADWHSKRYETRALSLSS